MDALRKQMIAVVDLQMCRRKKRFMTTALPFGTKSKK